MKTLPNLPALPAGYHWHVEPHPFSDALHVSINKTLPGPNDFPSGYEKGRHTRSFPAPRATTVVRTAKRVKKAWLEERGRKQNPLAGSYRAGAR